MKSQISPLKHLVEINPETLSESTPADLEFRYIDISAVGRGTLVAEPEWMEFGDAPSRARRVLRSGDTIISTVRTYLRAVWTARKVSDPLVASTGFACLRPKPSVDAAFLGWLLQSDSVIDEVAKRSVGVSYPAVNPMVIGKIRVGLPPLGRQRAVADYLDRETGRIDAMIEMKRQLVSLIRERKALAIEKAVITEAHHVPLRHYLFEVDRRSESGDGVLLSVSLHHGVIPRQEMTDREGRADDTVGYKVCSAGDLVLNRMRAFQGAIGVAASEGLVSPDYSVLRLRRGNDPNYFHHLLRTPWFIGQMASIVRGIGTTDLGAVRTPRVNVKDLLRLTVPLLPLAGQARNAGKAAAIEAQSNRYAELVEGCILLLREKRQALITDAVTGQLDISEAA